MTESIRLRFGRELLGLSEEHDFLIFNADTKSCGIENFGELHPERNFTFGIAEQNLLAAAAGAALCGERVFLATFAVFASMRACEQLRTFICLPHLNVTVLASHGGLQTGSDGATHIAVEDVSILRAIPSLTIVEPSDAAAAAVLARKTMSFHGPLYIRFPKQPTPRIHGADYEMEIGRAVPLREGGGVAILATGWMLSRALEAADSLERAGVSVCVMEFHTVKPLDEEAVLHLARRGIPIVTVEDNSVLGGLGSAVAEAVSDSCPVPVIRVGIRDRFGESGDPELLYRDNRMTVEDIVCAAYRAMQINNGGINA